MVDEPVVAGADDRLVLQQVSSAISKSVTLALASPSKSLNVKSPTVKSPNVKSPNVKSPNVKSPYVKSPNEKSPDEGSPNEKYTKLYTLWLVWCLQPAAGIGHREHSCGQSG